MTQDCPVGATSYFQGISQFGHPVECTFVVDGPGQIDNARCQPRGVNGEMPEAVAEDVSGQLCLGKKFVNLGAGQGMTGSPGLGTTGSISGGNAGVGSGGVPGGLTSRSLTGEASGTQFFRASNPIGKALRHIDRSTTEGVEPTPHAP
jgi:hypothetical protein